MHQFLTQRVLVFILFGLQLVSTKPQDLIRKYASDQESIGQIKFNTSTQKLVEKDATSSQSNAEFGKGIYYTESTKLRCSNPGFFVEAPDKCNRCYCNIEGSLTHRCTRAFCPPGFPSDQTKITWDDFPFKTKI